MDDEKVEAQSEFYPWAKTIGDDFAKQMAHRWNCYEDLLGALKHCVIERGDWLDEARAAIAKAQGKNK
jgi:hypothetical protein